MEIGGKSLATLGTIIGIVLGATGMWFTLKDRMANQIEKEVTHRVQMETKVARIDERLEAYKSDIWILKGKVDALEKEK